MSIIASAPHGTETGAERGCTCGPCLRVRDRVAPDGQPELFAQRYTFSFTATPEQMRSYFTWFETMGRASS